MLSPKWNIYINPLPDQHSGNIPEEGTKRMSELGDKEYCDMLTFGHDNHEFTAWIEKSYQDPTPGWEVDDCWEKESYFSLRGGLLVGCPNEWPIPMCLR